MAVTAVMVVMAPMADIHDIGLQVAFIQKLRR